jgi:hypothetical protein
LPTVPSTQPKPMSWQWISAFFDAEGCIVVKKDSRGRKSVDIWLQIHQLPTSGVLLEIREFLQARGITVYYREKGANTFLQINKKADVEKCLKRMFPYLRVKRNQAQECLKYLNDLKELQREFGMRYWLWTGSRISNPRTARGVIH